MNRFDGCGLGCWLELEDLSRYLCLRRHLSTFSAEYERTIVPVLERKEALEKTTMLIFF